MAAVLFSWGGKDVAALREVIKRRDAMFLEALRKGWQRAGLGFIGFIVKNQMRGRPGLRVGHGQLWNSWVPVTTVQATAKEFDATSRIGTDVKYARIHQYGGTIRPKRGRFLYVPTSDAGRANHRLGGNPTREGLQYGRDYVLKRSVHIPKRLHVLETYKVEGLALYVRELQRALNAFKGGSK
jgi:hypothetical protein